MRTLLSTALLALMIPACGQLDGEFAPYSCMGSAPAYGADFQFSFWRDSRGEIRADAGLPSDGAEGLNPDRSTWNLGGMTDCFGSSDEHYCFVRSSTHDLRIDHMHHGKFSTSIVTGVCHSTR